MRILHVFRSPVGGLFRHARDLARGQADLGHTVGFFCDSSTGGNAAIATLEACQSYCSGGIVTSPISRLPSPSDLKVIRTCHDVAARGNFDVIHGHGAKGGLVARLVGRRRGIPSIYTPHGGSLHYAWNSPSGAAFLTTEKLLGRIGSGFVFVCDYERRIFAGKIGLAGKPCIVAHNGLWPDEFVPVTPNSDATDLVFVGEVRHLKGIDLLFGAMKQLRAHQPLTLTVVGDGPELEHHKALAITMGLHDAVRFAGRLPIRQALAMGRLMVVPSRNESFPYVVLETVAAAVPIIASKVGGIPEVLPEQMMCEPATGSIAMAISHALAQGPALQSAATTFAGTLRDDFSAAAMARKITDFYQTLPR